MTKEEIIKKINDIPPDFAPQVAAWIFVENNTAQVFHSGNQLQLLGSLEILKKSILERAVIKDK